MRRRMETYAWKLRRSLAYAWFGRGNSHSCEFTTCELAPTKICQQRYHRWNALMALLATAGSGASLIQLKEEDREHRGTAEAPKPELSIYDKLAQCVCKVDMIVYDKLIGCGSGFVISMDGFVVTNSDVIRGMMHLKDIAKIKVGFDDGRVYYAEPYTSDPTADIGIIKLIPRFEGEIFSTASIGDSATMKPGDPVMTVGSPRGGRISFNGGVLSSKYYGADDPLLKVDLPSSNHCCFLQVDSSASTGNGGGPIVDKQGNVIAILSAAKGHTPSSKIYLGTAMQYAWPVIQQLVESKAVRRPWLGLHGIRFDHLDWEAKKSRLQIDAPSFPPDKYSGLLVKKVLPNSPAEAAGLRDMDVILAVNNKTVTFAGDLYETLGPIYDASATLKVEVFRALDSEDKPRPSPKTITLSLSPQEVRTSYGEAKRP